MREDRSKSGSGDRWIEHVILIQYKEDEFGEPEQAIA